MNSREYYRLKLLREAQIRIHIGEQVSSPGDCDILDFSAGGCMFITKFLLPINHADLRVILDFKILQQQSLIGKIVWRRQDNKRHRYGCQWLIEDSKRDELLQEIQRLETALTRVKGSSSAPFIIS